MSNHGSNFSGGILAETGFEPLHPATLRLWRFHSGIGSLIWLLLGSGVAIFFSSRIPPLLPFLVGGIVALLFLCLWHLLWYTPRLFVSWGYRLDDRVLEVRHGVFTHTLHLLPLSRLQHVDLQQGALQRRFGLATLTFYTAGTHFVSLTLQGLNRETAKALRDRLIIVEGDDAV